MTEAAKALAVGAAAKRLVEVRSHYATLAEVLKDREAEQKLAEIDRSLGRLRAEAARLETQRSGADDEATREADRYFESREHTRAIEAEFLGLLDGLLVEPVLPGTEERVSQALTTIGSKYGPAAAEHCKKLLPPGPVDPQASEAGTSAPYVPR